MVARIKIKPAALLLEKRQNEQDQHDYPELYALSSLDVPVNRIAIYPMHRIPLGNGGYKIKMNA